MQNPSYHTKPTTTVTRMQMTPKRSPLSTNVQDKSSSTEGHTHCPQDSYAQGPSHLKSNLKSNMPPDPVDCSPGHIYSACVPSMTLNSCIVSMTNQLPISQYLHSSCY